MSKGWPSGGGQYELTKKEMRCRGDKKGTERTKEDLCYAADGAREEVLGRLQARAARVLLDISRGVRHCRCPLYEESDRSKRGVL